MSSASGTDVWRWTSEGFAIDEPVQLSTMLASGFVILKVASHHGEHLICLDARKRSGVDYAKQGYIQLEVPVLLGDSGSRRGDGWSKAAECTETCIVYATEQYWVTQDDRSVCW